MVFLQGSGAEQAPEQEHRGAGYFQRARAALDFDLISIGLMESRVEQRKEQEH